ncbi:TetR/AcrR family transcriptional regulator [Actinomycetospora chibensis]|uniref:TetR/AcrR family transcriptional regulator n=1 Tax=Actinomycetospora chibensis TaxID=663606 RepID=A0ABV9RHU4_9PSEU|nr:TetR/AcrR family transcriptional regulator [Actinomycetospora chibensis]MDD7925419.1 helix-turn-helix domain containing protein [Actinomycetospora chibensis]
MARTPAPGTRERILTTASRLFYSRGVRAVGMNQIITEAGTGKNLLYSHFPTKSDLVAAYLLRAQEFRLAGARRARESADGDARSQLIATVAEVATLVQHPRFRGCAFRNYLAEFPDETGTAERGTADAGDDAGDDAAPTPAAVARDFLAATREELAAQVAALDVADPDRLTEELWLIVDGLFLQAAYRRRLDGRVGADAAVDLAGRLVDAAIGDR